MKVANMSEMVKKPGGTNVRALCTYRQIGGVYVAYLRTQPIILWELLLLPQEYHWTQQISQ